MADRLVALPGLRNASWRGIPFAVYDLTTPAGRRLQSIDLPGTDITIHEDLGLANGPIRVSGLIFGDDISDQARALELAFNTAGPGTLVHPWYGARTCILANEGGEITFRPNQLRGLSFQATFLRWSPTAGAAVSTLAGIASAATGLTTSLGGLMAIADEVLGGDLVGELAGGWTTILETIETTAIGATLTSVALSGRIGGLAIGDAIAAVASAVDAVSWVSSAMAVLADAGVPPPSPAVGAGPLGRSSEAAADPLQTATALIAVGEALAASSIEADGEAAALVRVAMALGAEAAMVEPLAAVDWESRQQAQAMRSRISAAITAIADRTITTVDGAVDAARQRQDAWRALGELRRRIHEDLDDRIGRLPSVMTIRPPAATSAWLIAQHVAGDDPKAVLTAFDDLVTRNQLAHPAVVGLDEVEVLPPESLGRRPRKLSAGTAR